MAVFLLLACGAVRAQTGHVTKIPVESMTFERLPDLNVPRSGHALVYINGELTAFGGHTTGFIPTATIEYYRDGRWERVPTLYTHDFGFALRLRSG